jgi:class 3 adenylate cyclase/tetratricopeptide (TPR) repeat protein
VTVLFCDLVGFTSRSDRADPEDVKAMLLPFHSVLKQEIERFGGTLDKFIGDAALGVFGSPLAHEDDPERAVRAATSITKAIDQLGASNPSLDLAVRIGVNTGEAVVSHGTGPQIGESVTGDVVNTASRLQGVAPIGDIVVGETTFHATKDALVYEALPSVTVKGKSDPLAIWRVVEAPRPLAMGPVRAQAAPFVGRETDLRSLVDAFTSAISGASPRLVTIVGEPGVGKSRLVAELARHIVKHEEPVTWRQGRAVPYGEGVTFWPLGEIVKAHTGILDSDSAEEAAAKLEAAIPPSEPDRDWLRTRLGALVGTESSSADREESFTAWRRFLESISPAVFVFEDVHWADEAMLSFIEHVAGTSAGVPMLLLCTARHELYDRFPDWGATPSRLDLAPLSSRETSALITSLLKDAELPVEVHHSILERAGGNPLYAEEFVRMLDERGFLTSTDRTRAGAEAGDVPFPDSLQALIAARIDTVTPERKAILQDASVMGRVFWFDAVSAIGDRDDRSVEDALTDLSRREMVQPTPVSSIEGQDEYSFWHVLIRDVAYGQIPRGSRAMRHLAAARWIERVAAGRVEDQAEFLAHHYTMALDLARASGRADAATELEEPAVRFLVLAGDRALGLDVTRAEVHYGRALELVPKEHPERPHVLAKWAEAVRQSGRAAEATRALEEAIATFVERNDRLSAGRALGTLASLYHNLGIPRQEEVALEAVRLLELEPAGEDLVAAYARMAGVRLVQGDHRATVEWAERAATLAADLGIEVPARALGFRGYGRCLLGQAEGLDDMRAALALAVQRGEGRDAAVHHNNLTVALWPLEGPAAALEAQRRGIEFAERRGITEFALALSAGLDTLVQLGRWDEVLERAEALAPRLERWGDVADLLQVRWAETYVLASRGDVDTARPLAKWLVKAARDSAGAEDVASALAAAALVHALTGERDPAVELLTEIEAFPHVREVPAYAVYLPEMVRIAVSCGAVDLAERLASGMKSNFPYWEHALCHVRAILSEVSGRVDEAAAGFEDAAERWRSFGVVTELAHATLGRGRCLLRAGHPEAPQALSEARDIFQSLEARTWLDDADALLAEALGS